jgi:hypothetical protein
MHHEKVLLKCASSRWKDLAADRTMRGGSHKKRSACETKKPNTGMIRIKPAETKQHVLMSAIEAETEKRSALQVTNFRRLPH